MIAFRPSIPKTEEHILSELNRLRATHTTLLVSHRVSTARHADRIVVLEAGRIMEVGTHAALINAGGYYAELERVQREGADEGGLCPREVQHMSEQPVQRDHSMFDADLSGAALNMHLLGRLLQWLKPYRKALMRSAACSY